MSGYAGAFQPQAAGGFAPVARDVVNYLGENTQPGVKSVARAVAQGIREGLSEEQDPKK